MNKIIIIIDVIAAVALVYIALFGLNPSQPLSGVPVGNDYYSTTTSSVLGNPFKLLRTGQGTLGSVVITTAGAAGGRTYLYDATTTSVLLRTGQPATSTITIASFATNTGVGTYVFDTVFNTGLLMEASSAIGTTTVTWR